MCATSVSRKHVSSTHGAAGKTAPQGVGRFGYKREQHLNFQEMRDRQQGDATETRGTDVQHPRQDIQDEMHQKTHQTIEAGSEG